MSAHGVVEFGLTVRIVAADGRDNAMTAMTRVIILWCGAIVQSVAA